MSDHHYNSQIDKGLSPINSEREQKAKVESWRNNRRNNKKKRATKRSEQLSFGAWNSAENQAYLQFLVSNAQDFYSQKTRRRTKVFDRLSKVIKQRTADQCRSHHQKLQLRHKDDLGGIINEIQRKIQTSRIQQYVQDQRMRQLDNQKVKDIRTSLIEKEYKEILKNLWCEKTQVCTKYTYIINTSVIASW